MTHHHRPERYRGYTITISEWGGMYSAVIEKPDGGTMRTGYMFEALYARNLARKMIDDIEDAPPMMFGAGTKGE